MKIIKLLSLVALGAVVLSSCKNNMQLTKRHYTKGYYFHKSKSVEAPEVKEGVASKSSKKESKTTPIEMLQVAPSKQETKQELVKNNNNAKTLTASTEKKTKITTKAHKQKASNENKSLNETKKELKYDSDASKSTEKNAGGLSGDAKLIVCVILAIIIPPLGMYLWNEKTDLWFILDLIFFLLMWSWFFWGALGLLGLAAIVIALLRVFDKL